MLVHGVADRGRCVPRPHTCRKGHEGLGLNKLPLIVQEIVRVELVWKFPLSLLFQNRGQMWDNERTLAENITSKETHHRETRRKAHQYTIHLLGPGASYFRN